MCILLFLPYNWKYFILFKKKQNKKNKISKSVYTRIAHFTDCDNVFQLNNSDSGNIVLIGKLDYEDKEYCNLTLTVNIENV